MSDLHVFVGGEVIKLHPLPPGVSVEGLVQGLSRKGKVTWVHLNTQQGAAFLTLEDDRGEGYTLRWEYFEVGYFEVWIF